MTHHRLYSIILAVLLLLGIGWSRASAQVPALQLCGQTQFTDFVVLGAVILDGPRTIVSADWIQTIPHFYTIAGPLTIIRDPDDIRIFLGLGTVAAKGEPFPSIPSCTVQLTLTPAAVSGELIFDGQAIVTCPVNGEPVASTLNVTLGTCNQPPFPTGQANISPGLRSQMTETRSDRVKRTVYDEDFPLDADRAAAGPAFR